MPDDVRSFAQKVLQALREEATKQKEAEDTLKGIVSSGDSSYGKGSVPNRAPRMPSGGVRSLETSRTSPRYAKDDSGATVLVPDPREDPDTGSRTAPYKENQEYHLHPRTEEPIPVGAVVDGDDDVLQSVTSGPRGLAGTSAPAAGTTVYKPSKPQTEDQRMAEALERAKRRRATDTAPSVLVTESATKKKE
jgi:hypothetical protein